MHGLIIDGYWVDKILSRDKDWELRSTPTTRRGRIGLIRKGSCAVSGVADLVDVVGPLSRAELRANARHLGITPREVRAIPSKYRYAWVLRRPKGIEPVPYKHKRGIVIWVPLTPGVTRRVEGQL